MKQRVFVILIAKNGEAYLPRTCAGVAASGELIAGIVTVDVGSTDRTAELLADLSPRFSVRLGAHAPFAESVAAALRALSDEPPRDDDLVWILHDDSAPAPDALAHLAAAFELGPSVAVAGPKVTEWESDTRLREFGQTVTLAGERVVIGAGQLDQSQFDDVADVLAVGTQGMLIRRSLLTELDGLDPALSFGDDGLDLCIRARLTKARVIRVPAARVAHAEGEGREGSLVRRGFGARRLDRWYRRIVSASPLAAFLLWLTAPLAALGATVRHLIAKHPGRVPGELLAAVRVLLSPRRLVRGRRRFRATRSAPLSVLKPLYQSRAETRAARAAGREREVARRLAGVDLSGEDEFRYWESRAPWLIAFAAVCAVVIWFPLLSASAVSGGGALPLSDLGQLWRHAIERWVDVGSGTVSPADPFVAVLAVLGTLSPWNPSASLVWLILAALPLAAFGGGVAMGRLLGSGRAAAVGSIAWMCAPPLLSALAQGRIGAIIAHLCIPFVAYFVAAGLDRRRTTPQSVTAFAAAALLVAVVVACAPITLIAVVPLWVVLIASRPRHALITAWSIVPTAALMLPTAAAAFLAGHPVALFSDPGAAVLTDTPSRLTVLAGMPTTDALGLRDVARAIGLPGAIGLAIPVAILLLCAVVTAFTPRWRSSLAGVCWYLVVAVAAVAIAPVSLASSGGVAVQLWTGSLLSIGYFGLVLAASGVGVPPGWRGASGAFAAGAVLLASVAPFCLALVGGAGLVTASTPGVFPAIVEAGAAEDPDIRVLTLRRGPDASLSARVERVTDGRLDATNAVAAAEPGVTGGDRAVAAAAAALVTPGADASVADALGALGVRFVVYQQAGSDQDAADLKALGSDSAVTKVATTDTGVLWSAGSVASTPAGTGGVDIVLTTVRAGALLFFLLLAIPTSRPARQLSRNDERDPLPQAGGDDDE